MFDVSYGFNEFKNISAQSKNLERWAQQFCDIVLCIRLFFAKDLVLALAAIKVQYLRLLIDIEAQLMPL